MALVELPDVLRHLNMPVSDTTYNTEIEGFINAATPIVAYIIGPVEATTFTDEVHDVAYRTRVQLFYPPIVSVTTATEYNGDQGQALTLEVPGTSSAVYGFTLESGEIVRRNQGFEVPFIGQRLIVTYQAGLASVPADVRLAVLEDIRALWQQTQNAARPQFGGGGVVAMPDSWVESMHMFPRLAFILENRKRTQSIA